MSTSAASDEAINQFSEALADDTYRNRANTLNGLGWAHYKKGDYVRAESYFKEVIDRDRRYMIAYDNLAKVYMATNRIDDAIATLQQVLDQAPLYPEANLDMGICLLKKDDKAKAREHFLQVIKVDPLGKLGSQAQEYMNIIE
ncbi:MAG: tetratricopeptide repeat protein [Deltaproteobacteria bacterium]|nr:tetratricopeptide repeat protein [Deltaproteobacteria bacterium]